MTGGVWTPLFPAACRFRVAAALAGIILTAIPHSCPAAELPRGSATTPADFGPIGQVQDFLSNGHTPGQRVAILGFPLCSDVDECRLLAGREYVSPRVPFSAARLEKVDQERLLHCLDPERGSKPCIIVLYGEAIAGRGVAPQRIEWRAYD